MKDSTKNTLLALFLVAGMAIVGHIRSQEDIERGQRAERMAAMVEKSGVKVLRPASVVERRAMHVGSLSSK